MPPSFPTELLADGRVISTTWRPTGRHAGAYLPTPRHPDFELVMGALIPAAHVALPDVRGADTIKDALHLLPRGLGTYSSYIDNLEGYFQLLEMRAQLNPHAAYFSYTIFGGRGHFADVEQGAMHASDLPHWIPNVGVKLPGLKVPGVYTSAGNAEPVFVFAGEGSLPRDQLPSSFIYESAHYGVGEHICHPRTCGFRAAHGTQWDDKGPNGENYDRELWLPGVLQPGGPGSPVQITIPEDPHMLTSWTDHKGQSHVVAAIPHSKDDPTQGLTAYEVYTDADGHWVGGEQGRRKAGAYKLFSLPADVAG